MPILMPGTTRLWPLSAPLRAEMPLEQPQKERLSDAEPQAAQSEGPSDGPFYLRHHPFSLLAVLAVEFLLLTFAVHATRLGPQLNQNAEDILAMQVDNRSRYLQSIFHDAQELTSLSDAINGLTQQLLDEGEISLSTLDSSSDAAYPLLEAAAPELISTLRIKS